MKYPLMEFQSLEELPHITEKEFKQLLLNTKDYSKQLFMRIMWEYGARISEVLKLKASDLFKKEDGYYIRMYRLKKRKAKIDILPVSFSLGMDIQRYIDMYELKPEDNLFRFNRIVFFNWLRRLGKKVLNRNINPHMFRHGRVYDLIKKGEHPLNIAYLLGWSDWRMIMRYYHPTMSDIRQMLERTSQ